MMKIHYNQRRSSFYERIAAAVRESDGLLTPVQVELGPRGLERDEVLIHVRADDPEAFLTDWHGTDESWFSARLRAAATVLRDLRLFGDYRATHRAGTLTLRKCRD